ncbi:Acetyltransferase, GNAT family protein [Sulfitobacter noctilucae]|uniref:GNAT family N-acetyltransferase n=1 Tax=Sulfitobacter noctilucae TaxID=1342302 RepID=UPI0004699FF2|nr:GNAT family N-acetyltransferase [Sulfitobacter noctilucae]KIN70936.1 Acetyltransferase, GNAT family protein [Sulfitobacter noctilucae]
MIHLRKARSTDAGKIGAILTEFTATTDWMPKLHTGAEDVAHAGRLIDSGAVIVAEQGGLVVGFAACADGDLDALYVAAAARGQGIGQMMLAHLMSQHDRLALWTFQANSDAQRFYMRHGFVEGERTDGARNDEKLPDVRYEWQRKGG